MKKAFLRLAVMLLLVKGSLGVVLLTGCGGDEPPPASTGPAQDIDMGDNPDKYLEGERSTQP
jgi:hypothetical protein